MSGWDTAKAKKRKREPSYKDDADDSDSASRFVDTLGLNNTDTVIYSSQLGPYVVLSAQNDHLPGAS